MTVIPMKPTEATPSPEQAQNAPRGSERRLAELSAPFKKELSGVVDRLIAEAAEAVDTAFARAGAESDSALQAAHAALTEQRQRHDDLAESLSKSEELIEELRVELQSERDRTNTARQACETAEGACARAEAACEEARAVREGMASAYESRLSAVQAELEAMRKISINLQQQLEAEGLERARLVATIRSVQQACATAGPETGMDGLSPAGGREQAPSPGKALTNSHDEASANDVTATGDRARRSEGLAATPSGDRCLTLIASNAVPVAAPRELLDYLNELFAQVDAIYEEDQRSRPLVEVVDRLTANLRCARDLFVKRATAEGVTGPELFDQQLSERLSGPSETPLSRHLAIAAHDLTHPEESYPRAEAS